MMTYLISQLIRGPPRPTRRHFDMTSITEDEPPKKKSKVSPKKATPQKSTQKSKSSKEKEDSDEEPWETFVPKEDTPDSGNVSYENSTLHPNTLSFLKGVFDFDVY